MLLYVGLAYFSTRAPDLWPEWILPPAVGFAIGFVLPSLVAPVLEHLAPTATTPISHAAWWPALVGLLVFMAPAVSFNLGARSLTGVVPGLRCDGRWGLAMMATGCGVTAFFARTAWLALGGSALSIVPALTLAACGVLYMFGRALDSTDRFPTLLAPVAVAMATVLGVATMAVETLWVAGIGFAALIIDVLFAIRVASHRTVISGASPTVDGVSSSSARPQTLAELEARARTPEFQPSPSYIEAKAYLQKDAKEGTRWLALHGPSGAGKSAAATRLIADMRALHPDTRVLSGNCRSNAQPYQPFHDALGDIWESMSTPGPQATASGLDTVLQELVGAIVPYWSLLSGIGHPSATSPGAAGEFYSAVTASLKRLARKQPIILFLDNLQWIDEGSAALLRHLHQRMPPGGDTRLTVLLCARDQTPFQTSGIGDCVMQLNTPSRVEQVSILTEAFSIEASSAQRIVDALGVLGDEPGGLFWLFQSVRELASAGTLQPTDRGFAFRNDADSLPVPADLRRTLAEKLHASNDQKLILRSAALLGEMFSVTTLAESLELDRLELLETLRQLEQTAHLVCDVPNDDDRYAFSSAFMFETVRDELVEPRVAGQRPPKLIQELHSRIATALERRGDPKLVFALARHWSLAGDRHAAKSFDSCLLAVRQARAAFTFDEARRWLSLAEHSAQVAGKPFDAALEKLRIDCDESHVTGLNRAATAESAWQLVEHRAHPEHALLVLAARSCYDASRDTGKPIWCDRGVALSRRIIASSEISLEQAAGYHLLGVSLPLRHADERLTALQKGLTLVESDPSDDLTRIALEAKLLSSLGEQLSYGDADDRAAARTYFERGLEIRTSRGLIDLPGQARAHGGLGRLALCEEPPDYDAARIHFVEDLRLSESIDDAAGVSMSHGALARCDRAAGDFAAAAEHLRGAREAAHATKDVYFAVIGQLELALDIKNEPAADGFGRELIAMMERDTLPPSCTGELLRILANVDADWAKAITDRLRSSEVAV